MKHISQFFAATVIASLLIGLAPQAYAATASEYEEVSLVATAYYSPLPGQQYYLRGDYAREKVLNGNGTHGASGRPVFEGMLAAPKDYAFGTRIYIEGLGVGSVEDRGGAIVNK
jgi:3D (Asp-Asp-Asp) domain-containing protein